MVGNKTEGLEYYRVCHGFGLTKRDIINFELILTTFEASVVL